MMPLLNTSPIQALLGTSCLPWEESRSKGKSDTGSDKTPRSAGSAICAAPGGRTFKTPNNV